MKGKKLQTGTAFLCKAVSRDRPFQMHRSEKNSKAAARLLAL